MQPIAMSPGKYVFPGFLCAFEIIFIVLFGILVRYDSFGAPDQAIEVENESQAKTTRTYPLFQDVHVMIFVGFGFLMTYLRRYGFSSVGFNFLLASIAIQWYTLTSGLFTFIGQDSDPESENACCTIRVGLDTLIGSDFGAAAVLITMGAVLGRASPFQLIIIAFFEIMFYSANEALNIYVLKAADIGGSMLIHTFGAYFGLGVSHMLYKKKATGHPRDSSVYHSDMFAMIGTLFLWLFWPSFNGALAGGNAQTRAIINTYYSIVGSVISSFLFSMLLDRRTKLSMTHVQNATLAGGVAVGAVADMVLQPWGALLIGVLAGCISVIGYNYLSPVMGKWFYLQDTCGVHNLHGIPGIFAGVASAVAAAVAQFDSDIAYGNSLFLVFPARAPTNATLLTPAQAGLGIEPGDGRHAGNQAGYQLALLVSTLTISILGGLLTGFIVRWLPTFHNTPNALLFDDALSWDLPDDADNFLPSDVDSIPINAEITPSGGELRHREVTRDENRGVQKLEDELKIIAPQQSPVLRSSSTV